MGEVVAVGWRWRWPWLGWRWRWPWLGRRRRPWRTWLGWTWRSRLGPWPWRTWLGTWRTRLGPGFLVVLLMVMQHGIFSIILPMLLLVATRLLWRTPWPSWAWRASTFLIGLFLLYCNAHVLFESM
ncbi:hypothetical protein RGQ29_008071 [Quercus rubra]|uniref:Uncharacterized protein n=1 Tax=Quercus rubra TaxID=3512 RepID=A0AAN7DZE9_QUERU|nr:hypothetical protein RGQ29_008071 [Quercus rubra]